MCKIADWIMAVLLCICAYTDWKKREVPLFLLIAMGADSLCCLFFGHFENMGQRLVGMLIGILFLIISRLTKEAVGYGDSWVILILGLHMGVFSMLQTLCLASVLAGVISLFLLWKYKWKKSMSLPFIPFVAMTYLGVMMWAK